MTYGNDKMLQQIQEDYVREHGPLPGTSFMDKLWGLVRFGIMCFLGLKFCAFLYYLVTWHLDKVWSTGCQMGVGIVALIVGGVVLGTVAGLVE